MNSDEKKGCKEILQYLSQDELLSLSDTVTSKRIKVGSKAEAITAIVTYSESAQQLMRRQKVKKDILCMYLADKHVTVSLNLEKKKLITAILNFWGSFIDLEQMETEDYEDLAVCVPDSVTQYKPQPSGPCPTTVSIEKPVLINNYYHTNIYNINNNFYQPPSKSSDTSNNSCQTQHDEDNINLLVPLQNSLVDNQSENSASFLKPVSSEQRTLAERFVKWFFDNLNSHNPVLKKTPEVFGPQHFWDDAVLLVQMKSTEMCEQMLKGPAVVANRLLQFTQEDRLLFNPNLNGDGMQVRSDPHGPLLILVCGTVHRASECLGLFQQSSSIIKDPRYADNWKVQKIRLQMMTTKDTCMPKLDGNVDDHLKALVKL